MLVGHHKVTFQVDTGATLNTLHARYADNVKPTTRKLKMWNNTEAAPLGICHTVVKHVKPVPFLFFVHVSPCADGWRPHGSTSVL